MAVFTPLRWILFFAAAFLGATFFVANWHGLLAWLIKSKRSSAIPLLGGALLAFAIAVAPGHSVFRQWWLPLILDPGCLPLLVATVLFWLRRGFITTT